MSHRSSLLDLASLQAVDTAQFLNKTAVSAELTADSQAKQCNESALKTVPRLVRFSHANA